MPTTFTFADKQIKSLVTEAMDAWHPFLVEADVQVGILMANNSDGPAIKHGGYPAMATMKVVGPRDRLAKRYEAELCIDALDWTDLPEECRMALLDHELSHISIIPLSPERVLDAKRKGNPWWKVDAQERPKLKSAKGSWNVGDGFVNVVARHGKNAVEFRSLNEIMAVAKAALEKGWHPEEVGVEK
jgi:hypothetical protein